MGTNPLRHSGDPREAGDSRLDCISDGNGGNFGAQGRNRTADTGIFSPALRGRKHGSCR
jgi:hypothetical protein